MRCTPRMIQRALLILFQGAFLLLFFFSGLTGFAQAPLTTSSASRPTASSPIAPSPTARNPTAPAIPLTYSNPILAGFYPDPSICRGGNTTGRNTTDRTGDASADFYLVNSSFAYFPGLPIFHSTDLVNWRQIGNAMNRPGQLDLAGAGVSRGLFAPALRYHKGLYYITCTLVDKGGNFVITAKDPAGPWSDPTWLPQVNGIDPSLFFDEDGKAFIIYNSIAPDNKPLYEGHRTIRLLSFDAENGKTLGEEKILVNGGSDISKHPVWIEGPHLYKKDGYYYLMAAEGGTEYNHSEVVFRSQAVEGPYQPYPDNPILTQRQLDRARPFPITSTGHADLVETPSGKWVAVFLGCRPYKDNLFNTGRETFMAPVEWKDGWPLVNPGQTAVQYRYPVPMPDGTAAVSDPFGGNAAFREDFNGPQLDPALVFLRTPGEQWYSLDEKKGWLSMKLLPQTCSGKENPAFMAHRQQHLQGAATTSLDFAAASNNEKAGLLVFQNETHFYFLCKSVENKKPVLQLYRSAEHPSTPTAMELLTSQSLPPAAAHTTISLKIEANNDVYNVYYRYGANKYWQSLEQGLDASFLSTERAGGFVGCMYALYATSLGKPSMTSAYFDWFTTSGNDPVYKSGLYIKK